MLKKELAVELGISGAMVTKLAKRGMPTDTVERAKRWRRRHLQPGMVKGFRAGTVVPPEPLVAHVPPPPIPQPLAWPTDWARITAPDMVGVTMVEAVGLACGQILREDCQVNQAGYAVAFLRDLMRRLDPDDDLKVRLPLCVWIALTDHALHKEANVRLAPDHKQLAVLNAEAFATTVHGTLSWPWEWLEFARDQEGYSVFGWPDDGQDDDEE